MRSEVFRECWGAGSAGRVGSRRLSKERTRAALLRAACATAAPLPPAESGLPPLPSSLASPLPLSTPLGRAATSRRATVTTPAAGPATLALALALRARPQYSTGSQGGADDPPFATEERGGRSHVAWPVSGRKGSAEWRRLLGNILPVPPSAHAAPCAHAPRVDLVPALTALRAASWRTISS